jgi:DNA-binding XRE family transcriptional regulator
MKGTGLTQRELARSLGINPTTLNNFLNHQSKALGGLAVALACTVVDVVCNDTRIGRITGEGHGEPCTEPHQEQLVLEFDSGFELAGATEHPTLVLRRPQGRHHGLRLAIRQVG